jgi:hypothetical protein
VLAPRPSSAIRRQESVRGQSIGTSTPSGMNITTFRTQPIGGTSNGTGWITAHHGSFARQGR